MSLSVVEIKLLQRLAATRPEFGGLSNAAENLSEHYGVGRRHGRRFLYVDADFERAEGLLKAARVSTVLATSAESRAERVAMPGLSEKVGTIRPGADSIAVKALSGAVAPQFEGRSLTSREGCYQVLTADAGAEIQCDVILVVENLETFRRIDSYEWLPRERRCVLVVYRGDSSNYIGDSKRFVEARVEPVWWFGDFDPAGLGLASGAPRLERVLFPCEKWLQRACLHGGRSDLFADSFDQWRAVVDADEREVIRRPWRLMSELGLGLPQEWMQSAPSG